MGESISLKKIFQACTSFQQDSFNVHLLLPILMHLPFLFLFYLLGIKYASTSQTVAKILLTAGAVSTWKCIYKDCFHHFTWLSFAGTLN